MTGPPTGITSHIPHQHGGWQSPGEIYHEGAEGAEGKGVLTTLAKCRMSDRRIHHAFAIPQSNSFGLNSHICERHIVVAALENADSFWPYYLVTDIL